MKAQRLRTILQKLDEQFPDADLEFADGYLMAYLDGTPTQEQIDAVPSAEYEEYKASEEYIYYILRVFGD